MVRNYAYDRHLDSKSLLVTFAKNEFGGKQGFFVFYRKLRMICVGVNLRSTKIFRIKPTRYAADLVLMHSTRRFYFDHNNEILVLCPVL